MSESRKGGWRWRTQVNRHETFHMINTQLLTGEMGQMSLSCWEANEKSTWTYPVCPCAEITQVLYERVSSPKFKSLHFVNKVYDNTCMFIYRLIRLSFHSSQQKQDIHSKNEDMSLQVNQVSRFKRHLLFTLPSQKHQLRETVGANKIWCWKWETTQN